MKTSVSLRVLPPVAAIALVLAVLLVLVPVRPAVAADAGLEAAVVTLLNDERAARGLVPLAVSSELTDAARRHSGRMAREDHLHHSPDLASGVTQWDRLGENVGRGGSVEALHRAFLSSPTHRRNVLDPDWRDVGVGIEVRDGVIWVTQVYRAPQA